MKTSYIVVALICLVIGSALSTCWETHKDHQAAEEQAAKEALMDSARSRAQAQFDLFVTGASFGEKNLLIRLRRANKLPMDSTLMAEYRPLVFVRDSLIWEIKRVGNDTLPMPKRQAD